MKALARHIGEWMAGKKSCAVYGNEIHEVLPLKSKDVEKRDKAIQEFARKNGLSATICDPGIQVIFRKVES